jgi:hypothetical protein
MNSGFGESFMSLKDGFDLFKSGDLVGAFTAIRGGIMGMTSASLAFIATPVGATIAALAAIGIATKEWFDFKIPRTTIASDFIINCLEKEEGLTVKPTAKVVWLGGRPQIETFTKSKKGSVLEMMKLTFFDKKDTLEIIIDKDKGEWLVKAIDLLQINSQKALTFAQLKADFEMQFTDFELFWFSKPMNSLKQFGLVLL